MVNYILYNFNINHLAARTVRFDLGSGLTLGTLTFMVGKGKRYRLIGKAMINQ